jgi:hypothetical protein
MLTKFYSEFISETYASAYMTEKIILKGSKMRMWKRFICLRALVNTVINFRVVQEARQFLTS